MKNFRPGTLKGSKSRKYKKNLPPKISAPEELLEHRLGTPLEDLKIDHFAKVRKNSIRVTFFSYFEILIFILGADPKTGNKSRERTGGICRARRDLRNAKRKTAKM